jgi:hypothetical protein
MARVVRFGDHLSIVVKSWGARIRFASILTVVFKGTGAEGDWWLVLVTHLVAGVWWLLGVAPACLICTHSLELFIFIDQHLSSFLLYDFSVGLHHGELIRDCLQLGKKFGVLRLYISHLFAALLDLQSHFSPNFLLNQPLIGLLHFRLIECDLSIQLALQFLGGILELEILIGEGRYFTLKLRGSVQLLLRLLFLNHGRRIQTSAAHQRGQTRGSLAGRIWGIASQGTHQKLGLVRTIVLL